MPKQYKVISDECELPRGAGFYLLSAEALPGNLVMFGAGKHKRFGIGRWHPDTGGANWIVLPRLRILFHEVEGCRFIIHGVVVPKEDPPKEIGDFTESERKRALIILRRMRQCYE